MNKQLGGVTVAVAVLFGAVRAGAEPRTHDGFQFRGAIGGGYLSDREKIDAPASLGLSGFAGTISGGAAAFELYFGGTPARGVIVGGFVSALVAAGPKVSIDGGGSGTASNDFSLNLATLGPYVDFYPDPSGGFHVLGAVGYSQVSASDQNGTQDSATSSGPSVGVGVGYDAWVSDEWSLGVLGRFTYAATSHETSGVKVTDNAVAPALLFSVCFQ